jgi:chemotaxis signal transduction protein
MSTKIESRTGLPQAGKYLTLKLGGEDYAVPLLSVREIIRPIPFTRIPLQAPHVLGVINLRGQVIPVADLGILFNCGKVKSDDPRVVVLEFGLNGTPEYFGVQIDAVQEVTAITAEQIEPPPSVANQSRDRAVVGLAKVQDRVVILLDLQRVLLPEQLESNAA